VCFLPAVDLCSGASEVAPALAARFFYPPQFAQCDEQTITWSYDSRAQLACRLKRLQVERPQETEVKSEAHQAGLVGRSRRPFASNIWYRHLAINLVVQEREASTVRLSGGHSLRSSSLACFCFIPASRQQASWPGNISSLVSWKEGRARKRDH